jgi:hypothetical protein
VQRASSDADSIAPPINNSGELTVLVDDVKITLLKYPFPTFDPFVRGAGRESRGRAMSERIETPLLSIEIRRNTKGYEGRSSYERRDGDWQRNVYER